MNVNFQSTLTFWIKLLGYFNLKLFVVGAVQLGLMGLYSIMGLLIEPFCNGPN